MCRQLYIRYDGCGCELRSTPLVRCCFGPQDPRCVAVINIMRRSPDWDEYCPYHTSFYRKQRRFTYTPGGFQLWANGRHHGVYWPIGKNTDYSPRSWDYFGGPAKEIYSVHGRRRRENEARFGLRRRAAWDDWALEKQPTPRGCGYEADDEAPGLWDPCPGGWAGYPAVDEKPGELARCMERAAAEDNDLDDDWLSVHSSDEAPLTEPTLMWGCWDGRNLVAESDVDESEGSDESEDDEEYLSDEMDCDD